MAPAATTTAPEQPAGLAGNACCECGPQSLCKILLESGAVRQRCAPDPAGQAADNARETQGRRGAAEGEAATGAAQGGDQQNDSRVDGEERDCGDEGTRPRTAGRPDATGVTAYGGDSKG